MSDQRAWRAPNGGVKSRVQETQARFANSPSFGRNAGGLPRGNVSGAVPADFRTTYTYNAAGRLLTKNDPLGNATTYAYDAVGNLTTSTDATSWVTASSPVAPITVSSNVQRFSAREE